ncbi:MAG: thioredoxin family protein [Planctomycetes bacterium]|nr:thioredoxin family protein [Planctomycetota bacterium]
MKTRFTLLLCAVALVLSVQASHAEDEFWMTDFEAAKAKAAKEKKDLLIDFTGSDWCGWCIKLKNEVFVHDAFKNEAPKSFVLVELDFPRNKELPENLQAQNKKLSETYEIQGFPTILLTDAEGKPYGRTGYQAGGPEAYLKHLGELKGRQAEWDKLLADAGKAEGVEKAKLLDAALEKMAVSGVQGSSKGLIAEIKKLDAENQAGLKAKYEGREKLDTIVDGLNNGDDADTAVKSLDGLIDSKPTAEVAQKSHFIKGQVLLRMKNDKAGAIACFKKAAEADPKSEMGQQLPEFIKKLENPDEGGHHPGDGHGH